MVQGKERHTHGEHGEHARHRDVGQTSWGKEGERRVVVRAGDAIAHHDLAAGLERLLHGAGAVDVELEAARDLDERLVVAAQHAPQRRLAPALHPQEVAVQWGVRVGRTRQTR